MLIIGLSSTFCQKYYGGLNNTLTYKGIQLGIFLQFVRQLGYNPLYQMFSAPGIFAMNNLRVENLNRWQQPGDDKPIQRYTAGYNTLITRAYSSAKQSDRAYTDASFIRLKILQYLMNYHQIT